jgi:hypothetical protein
MVLRNALERKTSERTEQDWRAVETAWAESKKAWAALEHHIAEHHCLDLAWPIRDAAHAGASEILGKAAADDKAENFGDDDLPCHGLGREERNQAR